MPADALTVRLACAADAEDMRRIYNREVTGSTVTFDMVPRSLEDQLRWIEAHSGAHPALVAAAGEGPVVGFASLTAYRDRPAYSTTVEDSVYVDAGRRGEGIGGLLLSAILELAAAG